MRAVISSGRAEAEGQGLHWEGAAMRLYLWGPKCCGQRSDMAMLVFHNSQLAAGWKLERGIEAQ